MFVFGGRVCFNALIMEVFKNKTDIELFIIVLSIFLVFFLCFITFHKIFHSYCRQSLSQHQKRDKYTLGALTGRIFEY